MSGDLYDELGVDRDATPDEIRDAYRREAKKAHPDVGGTAEQFGALTRAYDILSDKGKRERYDRTGQADEQLDNTDAQAMSMLDNLLEKYLQSDDIVHTDVVKDMRRELGDMLARQKAEIPRAEKQRGRVENVLKRMKVGEGKDPLGDLMRRKIGRCNAAIEQMQMHCAIIARAQEMVAGYAFEREPRPPQRDANLVNLGWAATSTSWSG